MSALSNVSACAICNGKIKQLVGIKDGYNIVQCVWCGFRFVDPMPTDDQLRAYYHSYTGNFTYLSKNENKFRRAKNRIKRWMKLAPGRTFLDVGCNAGFAVEAARLLSFQSTGIDLGNDSIHIAKKLFPYNEFYVASPMDFAQTGNKFDFIYCSEVIEHTNDPSAFVQALYNLLTPKGIVYLTTPDAGHFRVPKNFLAWQSVHPPSHLCYFNKSGLRQLLANHHIEVIRFLWNIKSGIKMLARKNS